MCSGNPQDGALRQAGRSAEASMKDEESSKPGRGQEPFLIRSIGPRRPRGGSERSKDKKRPRLGGRTEGPPVEELSAELHGARSCGFGSSF